MNKKLENLFVSKNNYKEFVKNVEKKLSDESKLTCALELIQEKLEDGMKDLNIQENNQMNILTIVVPSNYFAPQDVFICDVHLIKDKNGVVLVKY